MPTTIGQGRNAKWDFLIVLKFAELAGNKSLKSTIKTTLKT